ncbi:hypothetical protein Tco_0455052 [Tanacetum coccineum]
MDYLHHTEEELKIDFNKPLEEHDPLDELNDLANKKRKRADEFHDYFRSTEVQAISSDFVTVEDLEDISNEMLYTMQEVFFRFHQGPDLNDHARTFSSFLLIEVYKRNLNPIEQLRQFVYSNRGRLLGSVHEPFSLSLYLNIKSPKYNSKLKTVQLESLKKSSSFSSSAGQRKPEGQWTRDERKAANLDQRLKSLIMSVLRQDQMTFNWLVAEAYEWDKEDVSSDDNEMTEVKVLMALADDENVVVNKESVRNGEWGQDLYEKERVLGLDQLTKEPSGSGQSELIFLKSSADDTKVSIPGVKKPWLFKAEGFTLPNHDTGKILPVESQIKATDPLNVITDSSASEYESADESSICSTPLPPLEKIVAAEPVSGPMTIKSFLKSRSRFKVET